MEDDEPEHWIFGRVAFAPKTHGFGRFGLWKMAFRTFVSPLRSVITWAVHRVVVFGFSGPRAERVPTETQTPRPSVPAPSSDALCS